MRAGDWVGESAVLAFIGIGVSSVFGDPFFQAAVLAAFMLVILAARHPEEVSNAESSNHSTRSAWRNDTAIDARPAVANSACGGHCGIRRMVLSAGNRHGPARPHRSGGVPGQAELADRLRAAGISVTIIPFKGKRLRDQPRVIAAELQLARFIRSSQPDIVHAHLFKAVLCCRLATIGYPRALRVAQLPGMVHLDSMPSRWLDRWTLARRRSDNRLLPGNSRAVPSRWGHGPWP